MSEITDNYRTDANVHRWKITAKAAQLSGSGSITSHAWVITGDQLPAAMIDSDESTSEASGGPTIRASLDEFGSSQIALHIVDFVPASGGVGGGGSAEIWLNPTTYTGGTDLDVWLWWITGGSQTQPAASGTYGKNNVYGSNVKAAFLDTDYSDATSNANDGTGTNMTITADSPFGSNLDSWEFNGSSSRVNVSDDAALDMDTQVTMEYWYKVDADTGGYQVMMAKRKPATTYNYGTALNLGGPNTWDVGFYNLGYKGVNVTESTNFGSLDTWYHVFCELEESGSAVVARLYKGASSVGTNTNNSTTLPTNASDLIFGANSDTTEWFDGHLKAIFIYDVILSSDQKTTRHNNQNAPGTFWDTTAAVEDGPFVLSPKYQWTVQGKARTWTVKIFDINYTGTTTETFLGTDEALLTWGRSTYELDDTILASDCKLGVFDPNLTIYNALSAADEEEENFYVTVTDSTGTYTWRGKIRLDEVSTQFITGLDVQITSLYGYCGLNSLDEVDALTLTSSTFHNAIKTILASNAQAQDIQYITPHYPADVASTGAVLDLMRLNRLDLIYLEKGRKDDEMKSQLQDIIDGLGCAVWNGLDGQWHVKSRLAIGEQLLNKRGTQQYTNDTGLFTTLNTISASLYTASTRTLARGTRKTIHRPVQVVEITRGNDRDYITVDTVADGGFEHYWSTANTHQLIVLASGSYAQSTTGDADTGSYAMLYSSSLTTNFSMRGPALAAGQDLDLEIAVRFATRSYGGATVDSQPGLRILFNTFDYDAEIPPGFTGTFGGGLIYFGNDGDTWSSTSKYIFPVTVTSVTATQALAYTTLVTTIYGPLPIDQNAYDLYDSDGVIQIQFRALNTTWDVNHFYDSVEVRLKKSGSPVNKYKSLYGRLNATTTFAERGGVVRQSRKWWNGVIGLDTTFDGTRDELVEQVQVLPSATGSWQQVGKWQSEVGGYASVNVWDLARFTSAARIDAQKEPGVVLSGEVLQIVPPETAIVYASNSYVQTYCQIDLKKEITKFTAIEKQKTYTNNAAATHLYWADSNLNVKRAPIDTSSTPWTASTLLTLSATYDGIVHMHVDQEAGYIFLLASLTAGGNRLVRFNLDGTNETTLVSDAGNILLNFNIARTSQRIYACWDNTASSGQYSIYVYSYTGTLLTIQVQNESGDKCQWCCIDEDEAKLYYRHYKTVGSEDETREHILSTKAETDKANSGLTISGEINTAATDATQNKLYVFGSVSGADRKIVEIDLSSSGESDWKATTDGVTHEGFAIEHTAQKGAYPKTGGDIYWDSLASPGSEEKIYEGGGGGNIEAICFGYN